jgi:hypothetical protein
MEARVRFRPLYVLITPGRILVHNIDPGIDRLCYPYVLIIIKPTPNGNCIKIKCLYVFGPRRDQRVKCCIPGLDLLHILTGDESTVIEKLKRQFLDLDQNAIDNIIRPLAPELNGMFSPDSNSCSRSSNSSTPPTASTASSSSVSSTSGTAGTDLSIQTDDTQDLDNIRLDCDGDLGDITPFEFPGNTDFEMYINAFMAGIGSHLFAMNILTMNQLRLRRPFFPIDARHPPIQGCPEVYLTRSVGEYILFYARMLKAIARGTRLITRVGPSWLSLVSILWLYSSDLFMVGPLKHPEMAIYDAMLGYAIYQERKIAHITCKFRKFEERANFYLDTSRKEFTSHIDDMNETSQINIDEIIKQGEMYLKKIEESAERYLKRIEMTKNRALNDISQQLEAAIEAIIALEKRCEEEFICCTRGNIDQLQLIQGDGRQELIDLHNEIRDLLLDTSGKVDIIRTDNEKTIKQLANSYTEQMKRTLEETRHSISMAKEDLVNTARERILEEHQKSTQRLLNTVDGAIDQTSQFAAELERKLLGLAKENERHIESATSINLKHLNQRLADAKDAIDDGQHVVEGLINEAQKRIDRVAVNGESTLEAVRDNMIVEMRDVMKEQAGSFADKAHRSAIQDSLGVLRDSMMPVARQVIDQRVEEVITIQGKELTRTVEFANRAERSEAKVRSLVATMQDTLSISYKRALQVEGAAKSIVDISRNSLGGLTSRLDKVERNHSSLLGEQDRLKRENERLRADCESLRYQLAGKVELEGSVAAQLLNRIQVLESKGCGATLTCYPEGAIKAPIELEDIIGPSSDLKYAVLKPGCVVDKTTHMKNRNSCDYAVGQVQPGIKQIPEYRTNKEAMETVQQIVQHSHLMKSEYCANRIPTPLKSMMATPVPPHLKCDSSVTTEPISIFSIADKLTRDQSDLKQPPICSYPQSVDEESCYSDEVTDNSVSSRERPDSSSYLTYDAETSDESCRPVSPELPYSPYHYD